MIVNKELGRMWKVEVMAYLMIISWNLPGAMKENHQICRQCPR
jgi:hypothetical protein